MTIVDQNTSRRCMEGCWWNANGPELHGPCYPGIIIIIVIIIIIIIIIFSARQQKVSRLEIIE